MRPLLLLSTLAFTIACQGGTSPWPELVVATDRTEYTRADGTPFASVEFTARNAGASDLILGRCGSRVTTYVDRRENGRWVEHNRVAVFCLANEDMSPLRLPAGATHGPPALLLGIGLYRLRVPFSASPAASEVRQATSNVFVVR